MTDHVRAVDQPTRAAEESPVSCAPVDLARRPVDAVPQLAEAAASDALVNVAVAEPAVAESTVGERFGGVHAGQ
ncbi:hypothetical protein [Tessaracoccus lacteus]|uniref:Uncharacterized protein n=1 Tax=Tessaracoccus lacteus TaxID=3041766 RepID=A0ABY8PWP6_9ACTN|nr:hypothetical protein [Tessaracoccus sp. T21]WGT46914.1 hypothetical protein QH948_12360 [Tessaracoccus sp. T21]